MKKEPKRKIDLLIIHCSATPEDTKLTEQDLEAIHRMRGADGAGYHFYIRKNGDIKSMRPIGEIGAHTKGFNEHSIGICYEGGLDNKGNPKDTRTEWQKHSLRVLVKTLLLDYPRARVCGHRDLMGIETKETHLFTVENEYFVKSCPSFDVRSDMKYIPDNYHYSYSGNKAAYVAMV